MSYNWNYTYVGGVPRVKIATGSDIAHLAELDEKMWTVLSCPVKGLELDEKTLSYIDTNHDGHVHVSEVVATSKWLVAVLKDMNLLVPGTDEVRLDALDASTDEGRQLLEAARRLLTAAGKADADRIALDGLNYQVIKDSQQALMSYQNGDLDITLLNGEQAEQVKDDPEFTSVGAGYLWYISPNMDAVPELANLNLRRAITFALDRDSITNDVLKDGSSPAYTAVPAQFATGPDGSDFSADQTKFAEFCAYDPDKAAEYYEQAKAELGKPFPQEEELRSKSARLAELDAKLNLDRPAAQAEKKKPEQER